MVITTDGACVSAERRDLDHAADSALLARLEQRARSQMVQLGVFVRSTDKEVRRLQKHLIDLKEGDADNSDASLFAFFASLELSEPKAG